MTCRWGAACCWPRRGWALGCHQTQGKTPLHTRPVREEYSKCREFYDSCTFSLGPEISNTSSSSLIWQMSLFILFKEWNVCLALIISWHPPLTWWPWGGTSAGGWPGWPSRSRSPLCGCCRHTGSGSTPRTQRRRSLKASRPCQHNPERGNYLTWNKKGGWVRGEGNYTLDLFPIKSFAFFPILSTLLLNANGDFLSTKNLSSPTCWV